MATINYTHDGYIHYRWFQPFTYHWKPSLLHIRLTKHLWHCVSTYQTNHGLANGFYFFKQTKPIKRTDWSSSLHLLAQQKNKLCPANWLMRHMKDYNIIFGWRFMWNFTFMNCAASSSAEPPISPIKTIPINKGSKDVKYEEINRHIQIF